MKRKFFCLTVVLILSSLSLCFQLLFPSITSAASQSDAAGLQELITEGLANNQELQSLRRRFKGLSDEIPAAAALNDPVLKFGLLNVPVDTFSLSQEAMTQKQFSLVQQIPWFQKLGLRKQKAVLQAELLAANIGVKEAELARQVADAYYDLGFVQASLETNQRLRRLLTDMLRVAETRYSTGSGSQQDILRAQVEISELLDEKNELDRKLRTGKDRINQILHRNQFTDIAPVPRPELVKLDADVPALIKQAVLTTPWMRVRRAEVDLARTDIKLALQEYMPNFDFTVAYGQRDKDQMGNERADFFSAAVGFTIPLWFFTKQDNRLSGSKERFEAAQLSLNSLKNGLTHQIDSLVTDINTLIENYELLDQALMFQASQWADSSLAAYEVGSVEFGTLITADLRLLRYELKHTRFHYTLRAKLAELEELVGAPVPVKVIEDKFEAPSGLVSGQPQPVKSKSSSKDMITRITLPKEDQ